MFEENNSQISDYLNVVEWDVGQVVKWAQDEKLQRLVPLLQSEEIDGKALLMLTERDLEGRITIGQRKKLLLAIRQLHRTSNYATLDFLGLLDLHSSTHGNNPSGMLDLATFPGHPGGHFGSVPGSGSAGDIDRISPASSTVGGVVSGGSTAVAVGTGMSKTFVSVG